MNTRLFSKTSCSVTVLEALVISLVLAIVCMCGAVMSAQAEEPDVSLASTTIKSISLDGYNNVKMKWDAVNEAEGYYVQRSTSKDSGFKTVEDVQSTTFVDDSAKRNKKYFYRVIPYAYSAGWESIVDHVLSEYKAAPSPTLSVKTLPKKIKVKTITRTSDTSVKLTWPKASGASGYYVQCKKSGSSKWKTVKKIGKNSTSAKASGLSKDKGYYYRIVPYVKNGKKITKVADAPSKYFKCKSAGKDGSKSKSSSSTSAGGGSVYVTNTGACYHQSWCTSLRRSKIPMSLSSAVSGGYKPCRICC